MNRIPEAISVLFETILPPDGQHPPTSTVTKTDAYTRQQLSQTLLSPASERKKHEKTLVSLFSPPALPPTIEEEAGGKDFLLHLAVLHENEKAITDLLTGGYDPNMQNREGNTPLHLAAYYRLDWAVKLLLEKGANPNLSNLEGETPLFFAVRSFFFDGIKYFPDLEKIGELITVLIKTKEFKHSIFKPNEKEKVINLLLASHGDTELKNKSGQTPVDLCFQLAEKMSHFNTKNYLNALKKKL